MSYEQVLVPIILLVLSFGMGVVFGEMREEKKHKKMLWDYCEIENKKDKLEIKVSSLKSNINSLKSEKESLLNLMEQLGYSKTVKYDPYLKRYEACWVKKEKKEDTE